jgi:non-lysosomal glucosylceramidase
VSARVTPPPFVYEGERSARISFPLGGIGSGCIGLSGSGRLVDWEIFNRPAKGSLNGLSHFAVKAEAGGRVLDTRLLNGPYRGDPQGDFSGEAYRSFGFGARRGSLVGLPHFEHNSFDGRFPVATLDFDDPAFPGTVRLTAFNPLIPCNDRDSSLPSAFFEVTFTNPLSMPVDYTLAGILGHEMPAHPMAKKVKGKGWSGLRILDSEVPADDPDCAELLIATDAADTSHQTYFYRGLWYDALEVYWNDITRPGRLKDRKYKTPDDRGGMIRDRDSSLLGAHITLQPGQTGTVRMLIGWYVPNFHKYWMSPAWHFTEHSPASGTWKNWYATEWPNVAAVADEAFERWAALRSETFAFRDVLYDATLPWPMVEAAGANLSTLKSPTVLRLEDGTLYGWEGCHPNAGSCEGSCSHVWNYQQAVAFLFPALSRSMRTAEYQYNLDENGAMSFRLGLPLGRRLQTERPCVDGQFGSIMLVYRDWKLSGDTEWLRNLWPAVKRSLEYAWSPANADRWDPDQSGVLQGRQHHTLDMELFGPNGWLSGYYVGALSAAALMADALGDPDADAYRDMAVRGRRFIDEKLFNGSHFIQLLDLSDKHALKPYRTADKSRRLPGASTEFLYWSAEHGEIKYQLGEASFIDQLGVQWHASLYGLADIFEMDKARAALRAIRALNYKRRLGDVVNTGRVFGYDDEAGTIVAAWPPNARRPFVSIPYAQETMHGMEYALGQTLVQYGMFEDAIETFAAVRDRYDGRRRNPWSEMECGSNYARSLSSWGIIPACSGFSFDLTRSSIGFAPRTAAAGEFRAPFSLGEAWGQVVAREGHIGVTIIGGTLTVARWSTPAAGAEVWFNGKTIPHEEDDGGLTFKALALKCGDTLSIRSPTLTLRNAFDITQTCDRLN